MNRMQSVFFDLDDTLYPSEPIYEQGLRRAWVAFENSGSEISSSITYEFFETAYGKAREKVKRTLGDSPSSRNRLLYFKCLNEELLHSSNPELTFKLDSAYSSAYLDIDFSKSRDLIFRLSKRYKIGIITNQVLQAQLSKLMVLDPKGTLISFLITSEEAGVEKPHPKIFELAVQRAGESPENCTMIGDSWEHDIEGALKAGMRAIYYDPKGISKTLSVPTIRTLEELIGLLL